MKIGITGRSIKERYKYGYNDFNIEILETTKVTNLESAKLERDFKFNNYKSKMELPQRIKDIFCGYSECYTIIN